MIDLSKLEELARSATSGPWMRLFGERTVYDRMEDGCRGNAIVRADTVWSIKDAANLDYIAAANPATMLDIIALIRKQEAELAEARAESANSGTFQDTPSADTDELRNKLMYAAIDCGHSISHKEIILCCDDSKKGNALHQLSERLLAAAVAHGRKQGAAQDGGCAKHCGDVACDEACESHGAAQPGDGELPALSDKQIDDLVFTKGIQSYAYVDAPNDWRQFIRELAARQPAPVEPQGSMSTESPPEFYKYNHDGLEGISDRASLFSYGQLVGWRLGIQQGRAAGIDAVAVPDVAREALEATFEQRPGYLTKVSAAIRALNKTGGA